MANEPCLSSAAAPAVPIGHIIAWLSRQAEIALAEVELSLPQYRVLALLSEGLALPSSLADKLDVRPPSVTSVVDGLVPRGLVVRSHDSVDRRTVTHEITPAGSDLLRRADDAVAERLHNIVAVASNEVAGTEAIAGLASWGPILRAWRTLRHRQAVVS